FSSHLSVTQTITPASLIDSPAIAGTRFRRVNPANTINRFRMTTSPWMRLRSSCNQTVLPNGTGDLRHLWRRPRPIATSDLKLARSIRAGGTDLSPAERSSLDGVLSSEARQEKAMLRAIPLMVAGVIFSSAVALAADAPAPGSGDEGAA